MLHRVVLDSFRRSFRSLFYVPCTDVEKINKAEGRGADLTMLNLEDGVSESLKTQARSNAVNLAGNIKNNVGLRINSLKTNHGLDDLKSFLSIGRKEMYLFYPKIDDLCDSKSLVDSVNSNQFSDDYINLILLVESAKCIVNIKEILDYFCYKQNSLKLVCLVFGADDYLISIGRPNINGNHHHLLTVRQNLVTLAKAFNLGVIDYVSVDYNDENKLKETCIESYKIGFDGKQAIHPKQIKIINDNYLPSDEERGWAERIILEEKSKDHTGAFSIDGRMIDQPLIQQAKAILKKLNK